MFIKTILICLSIGFLGLNQNVQAQNKSIPAPLTNVTWKIDQLYADTLLVASPAMDSLRYSFDKTGIVTLGLVGAPSGVSQPFSYKAGNSGNSEFTIFFHTVPAETYQVVKLSAYTFIFTINKMTSEGTTSKLEYRLVPE